MSQPAEIPKRLKLYLAGVIVLGPLITIFAALADQNAIATADPLTALVLATLLIAAVRFPLAIRHRTLVFVTGAASMALILTVPWGLAGVIAFIATGIGHLVRPERDRIEALFNTCQSALYVVAGALVYHVLRDAPWLGPHIGELGSFGAIIAAGFALNLSNYALVSFAAALQTGVNPFRVWRRHVVSSAPVEATLHAIGVAAAIIAVSVPLALPILFLPVILVYRAINQTEQVHTDTQDALAQLVELLELRDPYTAGHSRRVAATAKALAMRLGMTLEEAELVESAGRVHDIGKIVIDDTILLKPDKLTEAEFAKLKEHPTHGAQVVARLAAYGDGHLMVRHHHERWDGLGYPDGIARDRIPLGARILAVADAFDAMTSARPYRGAMTRDRAIMILHEGAGTQWDPRVVAEMLDHLGVSSDRTPSLPRQTSSIPATQTS